MITIGEKITNDEANQILGCIKFTDDYIKEMRLITLKSVLNEKGDKVGVLNINKSRNGQLWYYVTTKNKIPRITTINVDNKPVAVLQVWKGYSKI